MSNENFQNFINPANEIGQLLQSHFVTLQFLLEPITVNELGDRRPSTPSYRSNPWLTAIHKRIPRHLMDYYKWPLAVTKAVENQSYIKMI
jgi:hypothetical protein